jgi:hypothetical protein
MAVISHCCILILFAQYILNHDLGLGTRQETTTTHKQQKGGGREYTYTSRKYMHPQDTTANEGAL